MVKHFKMGHSILFTYNCYHWCCRIIILSIISSVIILSLCSWVDPVQVNTYTGTIVGGGVLSGTYISYYVTNSYNLGYDTAGYMFNNGDTVIHGSCLLPNGVECDLRLFPGEEPEINYSGNWITIRLLPETTPAKYPLPVYILFFVCAVVIIILVFTICGRLIT